MGLLKNIINLAVKTAVESLNQKEEDRPVRSAAAPEEPEPENVPVEIVDWYGYFNDILVTDFPQYSISINVPVTDLVGFVADEFQLYKKRPLQTYKAEWGAPYSFVLYQDEKPVGVVMLGSGHCHSQNVKYLIARMYAKKLGIPYIGFYTQYPNERSYVINRISELMKV